MSGYGTISHYKNERLQEVTSLLSAVSEGPERPASEEDLLKEFSDLMDKIASQLTPSKPQNPESFFPAEAVALPRPIRKEIVREERATEPREEPENRTTENVGSRRQQSTEESHNEQDSSTSANKTEKSVDSVKSSNTSIKSDDNAENNGDSSELKVAEELNPERQVANPSTDIEVSELPTLSEENTELKLNESANSNAIDVVLPELNQDLSTEISSFSSSGLERAYGSSTSSEPKKNSEGIGQIIAPVVKDMNVREALVTSLLVKQAFDMLHENTSEVKSPSSSQNSQGITGLGVRQSNREENTSLTKASQRQITRPPSLETLEKVESALREAAKARDGKTITVRIDPPNLGAIKVDVTLRERELHARIVADSQMVASWIRERSHEIQHSLRKIGFNVDTVSLTVGSGETGVELDLANGNSSSFNTTRDFVQNEYLDDERSGKNRVAHEEAISPSRTTAVLYSGLDHWIA